MKCNDTQLYISEEFKYILINLFEINPNNIIGCKNNIYILDDPTKKSNDISVFIIKGKHPLDYNIDGAKREDFNDVIKLLDEIEHLSEFPEFEFLTEEKKSLN